jgi:hypothetical protein
MSNDAEAALASSSLASRRSSFRNVLPTAALADYTGFGRAMKRRLFISHISEERSTADRLKTTLIRDFLGLLDVFVSSDTESIAAGSEWLRSIEKALGDCAVFVVLCSPESVRRPWINFEAGAAWMRNIPLIPVCHSGLLPRDLRMPLSLKQGIELSDELGLRRFYGRVAKVLECDIPSLDFRRLALGLKADEAGNHGPTVEAARELADDRGVRLRLLEALRNPKFKWRTLERVAAEAALSEEQAADSLRSDRTVRFGRGKSHKIIVGLRSRVD